MTLLQLSEYIQKEHLKPLEDLEIKNSDDLELFHQKLLNIRMFLFEKQLIEVMPHYRGEQNYGWDILPGILRPPFSNKIDIKDPRKFEQYGTKIFKEKVEEIYGEEMLFKPNKEDKNLAEWDLLFQAQHAGVKTNLIDVSTNVFLSSFFMSEPSPYYDDVDGQLWGILVPSDLIFCENSEYNKGTYPSFDPYDLDRSFICNVPTFIDDIDQRTYQFRLFKQHGRFFASSDSDIQTPLNKKEFWKNMMVRLKVPPEAKKTIFQDLNKMNINRKNMMLEESDEADNLISEINKEIQNL